jgi:glycerol kinase
MCSYRSALAQRPNDVDIAANLLPQVLPSAAHFGQTEPALLGGSITIGAMAGDQQSALFGQACFSAGMAKNTYGTGCFMLMHTGAQFQTSRNGLLTTSAAQTDAQPAFALEGSVFVGGAVVQWLRDGLGAIRSSAEVQALADTVPDSGGVMLVPAFTGLGAPYWNPQARGTMTGLTRGSTLAHIARAALESIAFQSAALLQAMARDAAQAGAAALTEASTDTSTATALRSNDFATCSGIDGSAGGRTPRSRLAPADGAAVSASATSDE